MIEPCGRVPRGMKIPRKETQCDRLQVNRQLSAFPKMVQRSKFLFNLIYCMLCYRERFGHETSPALLTGCATRLSRLLL